jgi:PAS domain S-box-containing protein
MGGARILIVEDENIIAKDIAQRLETLGYTVADTVDNGKDAVESAGSAAPDLVLMDIILKKEMSGIEAAGIIRRRFDLPVIFLTAFGDKDTLARAKVTEPYGYVLKPFEDRELLVNIEIALHRHSTEKALRESEERFRMLAEASFEGIIIYRDGVVLDANSRLARMVGIEPGKIAGKRLFDLVAPEFRDPIRKRIQAGNDAPFELAVLRSNGTTFPAWAVVKRIPYGDSGARVMVMRDLTLQREAERMMKQRARSELYGLVVSALPLINPGAYQSVREDLIKIFSDRFDGYFRPVFEKERKPPENGAGPLADYIAWVAELYSNFGIDVASSLPDGTGRLEFRNCPWKDYSTKNPVFCMLCRAMASRSFAWVAPRGSVGLRESIAGGRDRCRLDFWLEPRKYGQ